MRPSLLLPCGTILVLALTLAATAGSLTPPTGPIEPTGRFGPRIDVATLSGDANSLHRITQAGSYYLSANIVGQSGFHGIEIAVSDVTIDLNGFYLTGGGGSLDAITTATFADQIHIKNGVIRNWGGAGIDLVGGIYSVENVTLRNNGGHGIRLSDFGCRVKNCTVIQNGNGGVLTGNDSVIDGCTITGNTGIGLESGTRCVISNNCINTNSGQGVDAGIQSVLINNAVHANPGNTTAGCTLANNGGI